MPNHVENDLTVRGSKQDVARFFETVRGKTDEYGTTLIEVEKLIPYPKHFADADNAARDYRDKNPNASFSDGPKDGYNAGGYEWCVSNWGTKWGFYGFSELNVSKSGTSATVSFQTAWSPAIPLFEAMGRLFPSLTFTVRYFEQGVGFKGTYQVKGHAVTKDETSGYRGQRGG